MAIPIDGYDPRDILSGHYLIYRLGFNHREHCNYDRNPVYLCLNPDPSGDELHDREISYLAPFPSEDCKAVLKGRCENGRFLAGIERFYIPEEYAGNLDRVVRSGKGKIVVAIDQRGNAAIKDLLINDEPWKDYINKTPAE